MTVRGILCDLDGVVYRGDQACPGAVEGLNRAKEHGVRILYMTNNASRTPDEVAAHISGLGVPTRPDEVLTASQVAARVLRDRQVRGTVLAIGGKGVGVALSEAGLSWVGPDRTRAAYEAGEALPIEIVVQGYGAQVAVRDLDEATFAIRAGAGWVATNEDATLPMPRGLAVGNGSLVAAVARATGRTPEVVGKPHTPAYDQAVQALGLPAEECLMLGDRLDTDIAGAARAGLRSAMVLTGVSTEADIAEVAPDLRPNHLGATIPDLEHLWTNP